MLFKLIERLCESSDEARTVLGQFWDEYERFITHLKKNPSIIPEAVEFAGFKKNISERINRKLLSQLADTVQQARTCLPALPSLTDLRQALYQYYQLNSQLQIHRISGELLDLAHCYINLAIVESKAQQDADKAKLAAQSSTFYRPSSYEEIKQTNLQMPIPLEKLFDQRKLRNDQEGIPKRILIQGRAGIGKTTLCKKLVQVYQQGLWQDRFDTVLWVPLRELKTYETYDLPELLKKKYFSQRTDKALLAEQLSRHTDRILFILDGLDEVATELGQPSRLGDFLASLLAQPQVIVTSRPAGVNASRLKAFDLELETIGFSSNNIQTYLEKVEPQSATEIQALIAQTPVMRELANIPVQLDTLCYSWQEVKAVVQKGTAVTMTMLYQAMMDKLWRKDAQRLNKAPGSLELDDLRGMSSEEINMFMADEIDYLSYLSFKGLQDNLLEFEPHYLNSIKSVLNRSRGEKLPISLQRHLKQTSFLHTADPNLAEDNRKYHFLHLTFQEFFAAKFLAGHLQAYLTAEGKFKAQVGPIANGLVLEPAALQHFVNQHKYEPRYQIVWWMVAGLLEGEMLEGFFHLLDQESRELDKERHLDLIMHGLHEAGARLSQPTIQRLKKALEKGLLLALESKKEDEKLELGTQLAFPEHLLLELGKQHREYRDLIYQILGRRHTLSDKALTVLESALRDNDGDITIILWYGLGAHAVKVEAIQVALLKRFKEEKKAVAIATLAMVLGSHADDVEAIRVALLKRFEEEKESMVIAALAAGLGWHTDCIGAIRVALLKRFEEEKEPMVSAGLAQGLGFHAGRIEVIRVALLKRFEEEKEPKVIVALAQGLGFHAGRIEVIRVALLKRFEEEKELEIRVALAQALGWHADNIEAIRVALLRQFEEEKEPDVIAGLAQGLGSQADHVETIRVALLKRLEEEKEPDAITALAMGLGMHASDVAAIQVALLKRFEDEKEPKAIVALVKGLGLYADNIEEIRVALLRRFEEEKEPDVIAGLVQELGSQAEHVETIRVAILKRLEEEKDPVAIAALVRALGSHVDHIEAV